MKLSRNDAIVSLVAIALCSLLLGFYVSDVNAALTGKRTEALGSIVFKKRTATRKPANSIRWEKLKNQSTVYEGDTIRTSDASEAAVTFEDGTSLDVFENSMLKVSYSGGAQEFQYLGGAMSIDGAGKGTTVVKVGDSKISVSSDSLVSFSQDGDTLSVDVASGNATVTDAKGAVSTVSVNEGLRVDGKNGSSSVVKLSLVPLEPVQNARFLDRSSSATVIPFSVKLTSSTISGATLSFELSRKSDFSDIAFSSPVAIPAVSTDAATAPVATISAEVGAGVWFWRFLLSDGSSTPSRRLSLIREAPVTPSLPEPDVLIAYRTRLPAIHFSWSASEAASAVILEIADNERFSGEVRRIRTTLQSLSVQTLNAGTWYWRVVPVYPQTVLDRSLDPQVRAMYITEKAVMAPPVPVMPSDGLLFQVQEAVNSGCSFSWKPEPEAVSYELSVFPPSDEPPRPGAKPLSSLSSTRPFIQLKGSDAAFLSREGIYWWSIRWKDGEGNISEPSKPRSIHAVDGKLAMRLAWPPDGYTVADSLTSDIRYAWKSNVTARTVFQVARDRDFGNIVIEESVRGASLLGKPLDQGTYFWRLRAFTVDDTAFLETPAQSFTVVGPLTAATVETPVPGSTMIVPQGASSACTWKAVPLADYYDVSLSRIESADSKVSRTVAFTRGTISGTSCEIPLGTYPAGTYEISLQAFTLDSMRSTRNIGLKSVAAFTLRKLVPVVLVSPVHNVSIDGLDAQKNGVTLRWKSDDAPAQFALEVTRNGSKYPVRYTYASGDTSMLLANLPDGKYTWRIRAKQQSFDMSSKAVGSFTVKKIPLLPAPKLLRPSEGSNLGPETFKSSRNIKFSWTPVSGATVYKLRIYSGSSSVPLFVKDDLFSPEFSFTGLSLLDRGSFVWEVTAERYWPDGKKAQGGTKATGRFAVTLPEIETLPLRTEGGFYGY